MGLARAFSLLCVTGLRMVARILNRPFIFEFCDEQAPDAAARHIEN